MVLYKTGKISAFLAVLFLVILNANSIVLANEIHAFITYLDDDESEVINRGIEKDLKLLLRELQEVEDYTNLRLNFHIKKNNQIKSKEAFNRFLDLRDIDKNDVVFFYYGGHGYNNRKSELPTLSFASSSSSKDRVSISLDYIKQRIEKSEARLKLAIADCCNNYSGVRISSNKDVRGIATLDFPLRKKERFKDLYERSSGLIVACGSSPGQTAAISSSRGGIFTNAFLAAHKELTGISGYADWEVLMNKTKERTQFIANDWMDREQNAVVEINVRNNFAQQQYNWNNVVRGSQNIRRNRPNQYQYNNPYSTGPFVLARIILFGNSNVYFLMSDNIIIQMNPYGSPLMVAYRTFPGRPDAFMWDIVNPVNNNTIRYGVGRDGYIYYFNGIGWAIVGMIYF